MKEILERKTRDAIIDDGEFTYDPGEENCKVIACDDLDKHYVIVLRRGYTPPIDEYEKKKIVITSIYSPIGGVVKIRVLKMGPRQYPYVGDMDRWFLELREYFKQTMGCDFHIKENPLFDTVDTSYMSHNDEGDELGWVTRESKTYIGSSFTFATENYMYDPTKFEESRDFILRKLEDIFCNKGKARFEKVPKDNGRSIYLFKIAIFRQ